MGQAEQQMYGQGLLAGQWIVLTSQVMALNRHDLASSDTLAMRSRAV